MADPETHITGTEASGGKKLGAMRYVLGISLLVVVALFAILLVVYH
jgi:hypothetical protein